MLTALVIDPSAAGRRQVTGLLELAGWQVHEAGDAEDARWLAGTVAPDLVVTAARVPGAEHGPALLTELRAAGSTARFLVVAEQPTVQVRAAAVAAGALACLTAPIDARPLLDLVRRRTAPAGSAPVAREMVDVEDLHDADLDAELTERLQLMYDDALAGRLSAISTGIRVGDHSAVADAAHTLAGTSGQLGHPEVADVCRAIAADARRGIMAHGLLTQLADLARSTRPAAETARRSHLARVADAASWQGSDLVHAADAAAGRLAARRAGLAA
ncbi:response regulator [Modestobacter sp. SYSU DS0290]